MARAITFGSWLESQMLRREMSQSDLARRMETSNSAISYWIRGGRVPSPASCDKLADVFGIPVDEVLMMAGHRPRGIDEWEEDIQEVATLMKKLPATQREDVRDFARFRWERVQQRGRQRDG